MARTRNYKAEYKRRLANAAKRGLSRSQARGHPKPGEKRLGSSKRNDQTRLEEAYGAMRQSRNLSAAARNAKIAPERLRAYIKDKSLAERSGSRWVFTDVRARTMTVWSQGGIVERDLAGFEQASLNGCHLSAIKAFLNSNELSHLLPFEGLSVVDAKGISHPLETNPNTIHRLAASETEVFHEVYRLTI